MELVGYGILREEGPRKQSIVNMDLKECDLLTETVTVPDFLMTSPRKAFKSVDFPVPTVPTTATN